MTAKKPKQVSDGLKLLIAWMVALIIPVSTITPNSAQAAACCTSAAISGVGRLKVWEDLVAGVSISHQAIEGAWDANGSWLRHGPNYTSSLSTLKLWTIVRLTEYLESSLLAPLVLNHRQLDTQSETHLGVGHLVFTLRYEALSIGSYSKIPGVALRLGFTIPTGKRPDQTMGAKLATLTTAKGSWALTPSIIIEYAYLPWFIKLEAGACIYLPYLHEERQENYQLAPLFQTSLSGGMEILPDILIGSIALVVNSQAKSMLGTTQEHRSSYRLWSPSLSLSWQASPHWTISSTITHHITANQFGKNSSGGTDVTLGFRYGHF